MIDFEKYYDELDDIRYDLDSYAYGYTEEQWSRKHEVDLARYDYCVTRYEKLMELDDEVIYSEDEKEAMDQWSRLEDLVEIIHRKLALLYEKILREGGHD